MSMVRLLIAVGVAGSGYAYLKYQHENEPLLETRPVVKKTQFASFPPADGHIRGKVYVVAMENCSSEEAERADKLAKDLELKGIPVVRTNAIGFSNVDTSDTRLKQRMDKMMSSPLPLVFINSHAKSNPTLEEVVAQLNN